ncbi:DUF5327 family protein [Bacillaceae bacterium S4-13-58]
MPGVTYQQILTKMKKELDQALAHADQKDKVLKYVRSIKVMTELITDSEEDRDNVNPKYPSVADVTENLDDDYEVEHDKANGDSIFDF